MGGKAAELENSQEIRRELAERTEELLSAPVGEADVSPGARMSGIQPWLFELIQWAVTLSAHCILSSFSPFRMPDGCILVDKS